MSSDQSKRVTAADMSDMHICPEVASRAVEETKLRAQYLLELRHKIEVRAATLLRAFLTLAIAIVGFGIGLERLSGGDPEAVLRYALGAAPLFVAAACMVGAIWDRNYGSLGSTAAWYLRRGTIDGDETDVAYIDACLAESYDQGNSDSSRCNRIALNWIRAGLLISLLTPLCLCLPFVY